ncbi:MAG: hypothetical protein QNJ64_12155 [Crocosphaera sp.]|nr:hypothetical protein [Crocosphaera sp.]
MQLLKLYAFLKNITDGLTIIEQKCNEVLTVTPVMFLKGKQNTAQLRQSYQEILRKLTIMQTVVKIVKLFWGLYY